MRLVREEYTLLQIIAVLAIARPLLAQPQHPEKILWHDGGDANPLTFSLSPDGGRQALRFADGRRLRPREVAQLYGQPGGIRILDTGVDVASSEWAESRSFRRPRRVAYQDLSDRAGWPDLHVQSGTIALDPSWGRLKFAEGNPDQPLALALKLPLPHGDHGEDAPTPTAPMLLLEDDLAIVSAPGSGSAALIDVENPAQPHAHTYWCQQGLAAFLFATRGLLYTTGSKRERWYRIQDVRDPQRPRYRGRFVYPAKGLLAVVGDYGFILASRKHKKGQKTSVYVHGLHVPSAPYRTGISVELPAEYGAAYQSVLGTSRRLYAAADGKLAVVDISDPSRPAPLARLDDPRVQPPCRMAVHRRALYLLSHTADGDMLPHLQVYSVSASSGITYVRPIALHSPRKDPSREPSTETAGEASLWIPRDFRIEGDFLYASGQDGIRVYSLEADPLSPRLVDEETNSHDGGWNTGELHQGHLLSPQESALGIYRVRHSAERPSGRLTLQHVPEAERFRKVIAHVLGTMVALDEASAAAVIIRHKGETLLEWYHGKHDWSSDARPVDADSRFPIWSVTKVYVGTALGLALDAGKVELDDPVCRYVPEFTGGGKEQVTLRHLATHSSGLPSIGDWRELDLARPPGQSVSYCNSGMDLLAYAIGRVMGKGGFGQTLQEHIFKPLGLTHSGFLSPGQDRSLLIPAVETRKGEPWYDPWGPAGRGMAGLYVSARDLATFGELCLGRGKLKGKRILARATIDLVTSSQAPGKLRKTSPQAGLGWQVNGSWRASEIAHAAPPGTFAHGGGTHCYLMVCPALDLVAAKLLNRGYWPPTFDHTADYRRFGDLVLRALGHVE